MTVLRMFVFPLFPRRLEESQRLGWDERSVSLMVFFYLLDGYDELVTSVFQSPLDLVTNTALQTYR